MNKTKKKLINRIGIGLALLSSISIANALDENTLTVEAKTQSEFLSEIAPYAKDIASKNDLYASVMIAQAILETGWGNSALSDAPNYNLFGIKGSYKGETVKFNTLEDDGTGNYYTINDGFRKYPNYGASLQDYADLLTGNNDPNNWRYDFYLGTRRSQTSSYTDATAWLTGRYATDTRYGSKLNQLIENNRLTDYDAPSTGKTKFKYVVKPGDSYWSIARKFNITIEELLKLNNTNNTHINPNEILIVPHDLEEKETESVKKEDQETNNRTETSTKSFYIVRAGDSYWSISNKFNISIEDLAKLNNTNSYMIHPGDKIIVPNNSENNNDLSIKNNDNQKNINEKEMKHGTYIVKAGDSYWAIANKFNISINELARLNNTNDYLIHPGDKVIVPLVKNETNNQPEKKEKITEKNNNHHVSLNHSYYEVKAGDSYWAIANKFNISVNELAKLNNTNDYLIHPGDKVIVPSSGVEEKQERENNNQHSHVIKNESNKLVNQNNYYIVKAGDSYWAIANKFNISINELARLNNTTNYLIHPGDKIIVPMLSENKEDNNNSHNEIKEEKQVITKVQETPLINTNSFDVYIVKAGDSVWRIANEHNMSITELLSINNKADYLIHPGDSLKVKPVNINNTHHETPSIDNVDNVELETVESTEVDKSEEFYTVKPGDGLWIIANKHGISISKLQELNNKKDYLIHPGDILRVK